MSKKKKGSSNWKKELSMRIHSCPECGYTTDRDVAAAQVIAQRGIKDVAVGHTVQASGGIGRLRSL